MTDSAEAVELAAFLTAREFAEDGVKYLELRSTPRQGGPIKLAIGWPDLQIFIFAIC